ASDEARFYLPCHSACRLHPFQFGQNVFREDGKVDPVTPQLATSAAGKLEQTVDQLAHAAAAENDLIQVAAGFSLEVLAVILRQGLAEPAHGAKRRAQIVGDGIGDALQLLVGGL